MTDDQKKQLDFLQNLSPDQLQQFATMMAQQKQMNDPVERRKLLRRKMEQKKQQVRYQRAVKRGQQMMEEEDQRKRDECDNAQAELKTVRNATDNIDALVRYVEVDKNRSESDDRDA